MTKKPSKFEKRSQRAAIHAAHLTKQQGGDRIAQETAAIYARQLVIDGKTGATAIDEGRKAGLRMQKRINQTHSTRSLRAV